MMIMEDASIMVEAIEAMRLYHQARDTGQPDEEVEKLRRLAELQFQSISDYQFSVLCRHWLSRH